MVYESKMSVKCNNYYTNDVIYNKKRFTKDVLIKRNALQIGVRNKV